MHLVMGQVPLARMEARCSPEQVLAARLLALDATGFEAAVAAELDANPALERVDAPCPVCGGVVPGPCCRPGRRRADTDRTLTADPGEYAPATVTTAEVLLRDLCATLPGAEVRVARYVVASLDEHGILDTGPAEIAGALGVDRRRVDRVVAALRSLTCPGAAATSLGEHLLLDLAALGDSPLVQLAREVVAEPGPLTRGGVPAAARALGRDPAEVAEARDLIRTVLHPYPVLDVDGECSEPVPFAVPDLAVLSDGSSVAVRVVEADRVRLGLDERFARLACGQGPGEAEAEYARGAVAAARTFLNRVSRRWETMRAVAEAAVDHQREFVLHGAAGLRPLTRAALADRLGLHESTVGRAVRDRRVLLPSGTVVPFADFFPTAPRVREELRTILETERRPLTDAELAAELSRRGHSVARRTVVKYRLQLGFARASERG
ncbi:RNA polymerase factor sigma-54 [Nocardiopsis terrae]